MGKARKKTWKCEPRELMLTRELSQFSGELLGKTFPLSVISGEEVFVVKLFKMGDGDDC